MAKIRIGIFGLNRGLGNSQSILLNGGEIVAVCDNKPERVAKAHERFDNAAAYTDFDEFIQHDMDAVYIANYFHEHAPYAVKALERGIHVISECLPAGTMAECVQLVRAAEKSSATYMLAENYPYMIFNQEMRRVYQGGTLGKVLFAEGEYNHPVAPTDHGFLKTYYDSENHWRCYLPAAYYLTHSLGPLMMATRSNPIRVTAMPIFAPRGSEYVTPKQSGDNSAVILCLNDDNSVFRITGCAGFGAHENSYRLACTKGQIENIRGSEKMLLRYNAWDVPEGAQENNQYFPEEPEADASNAGKTGHGGGDYYMFKDFFDCISNGKRPYLDIYAAARMTAVAILAHRSMMEFGTPYDIPDFSREEDRVKYESDNLSPFWHYGEAPTLKPCSHPDYRIPEEKLVKFREIIGK